MQIFYNRSQVVRLFFIWLRFTMTIREDKYEDAFYNDVLKKLQFSKDDMQKIVEVAKDLIKSENEFVQIETEKRKLMDLIMSM